MANDDLKDKVDDVVEKSKKFTESLIEKATEFAQSLSEKAGQTAGLAKRKVEIEKQQSALYKKYRELGKAYYAQLKGLEGADGIDSAVAEIDTILATIEELEKEPDDDEDVEPAAEDAPASEEEE